MSLENVLCLSVVNPGKAYRKNETRKSKRR